MTAALLAGGAHSVVAGVADVADRALPAFSEAYHRRLRAGDDPSTALAGVLQSGSRRWEDDDTPPLPLTCFGSGW